MPTEIRWTCPIKLSSEESELAGKLKRVGKFYVFLRQIRAELFDEEFQTELAAAYQPRGKTPLPAALLAMVTLLQAYDQVGDAEAVIWAETDLRWQLPLDCLGTKRAPFSQGALVKFRERMIAHDLDRKLLDRTVALAKRTGLFGWQRLRAALDSSPLIGAGRVEDTWNLIGHALATVATCAAKAVGVPRAQVLQEAGITLIASVSLKAALDIDWDDDDARAAAMAQLLAEVDRLERWVRERPASRGHAAVQRALQALRRVITQDLEPDPERGGSRVRREVPADRMPSIGDPEMRHGRKSSSHKFIGYKRHVLKLIGQDLIVDAAVRPANEPEHWSLDALLPGVLQHGLLAELAIDRGYLAGPAITRLDAAGTVIRAKPWPTHRTDYYPKEAFTLDFATRRAICPAGQVVPIRPNARSVQFRNHVCAACADRPRCTNAKRPGRVMVLNPQEPFLQRLRAAMQTPEGRAALRERTTIEHSLARIERIQGHKARYKGARKNTLDLRRCSAIANLERLARARAA